MTNWLSRLLNGESYQSIAWHNSSSQPGVTFAIRRVSLLQRIELMKRLRDMTSNYEFLSAGNVSERSEASLVDLMVKRLYIEWGLAGLRGLRIDGVYANAEALISKGPESLCNEIVDTIRESLDLSETERKNS